MEYTSESLGILYSHILEFSSFERKREKSPGHPVIPIKIDK
jgi:hypothetical protein